MEICILEMSGSMINQFKCGGLWTVQYDFSIRKELHLVFSTMDSSVTAGRGRFMQHLGLCTKDPNCTY